MQTLYVFLQFGASTSEPLSNIQTFGFWGILLLLAALFVFFYIRTNKIVAAKNQSGTNDIQEHKITNGNDAE